MQSVEKLVSELEGAITDVIDKCDTNDEDIVRLIQKCSEAVATLRCIGDFELKKIMYDMARLASAAGWTPDDFDQKAQN